MGLCNDGETFVQHVVYGIGRGLDGRVGRMTGEEFVQHGVYAMQRWAQTLEAKRLFGDGTDVDEEALARHLAPLLVGSVRSLTDVDLSAVSDAANDERARRERERTAPSE